MRPSASIPWAQNFKKFSGLMCYTLGMKNTQDVGLIILRLLVLLAKREPTYTQTRADQAPPPEVKATEVDA